MIMLVNRIREIAYYGKDKKTLICNATIKIKLGNPVKIYSKINYLNQVKSFYLNKVFFDATKEHGCRREDRDQG